MASVTWSSSRSKLPKGRHLVGDEVEYDVDDVTGSAVSASVPQSPSRNVSHSADSSQGSITATSMPLPEDASPKIQKTLKQLLACQKEMQKQITMMVSVPITKEGRRLEVTIGQNVEKAMKANMDALWARIREEQVGKEKLLRDCSQQLMDLINNLVNKDLFATLEKIIKKELAASSTNIVCTITQAIENTIASSISDFFQRGAGDKAASQLEKSITSKLEATVARQIQAQFQTSGKQALQDGLKASLEACIIPAFEVPCKAVFEQVDSAFQKGMADQRTAAQHKVESMYSQLALRDALDSASSITQSLGIQSADVQRKLLALANSGPNTETVIPLASPMSNGPSAGLHEKVEQQFDLTKELSRLISEHKYDQAFTEALQRSDVSTISWLCSQPNLPVHMQQEADQISSCSSVEIIIDHHYQHQYDHPPHPQFGFCMDTTAFVTESSVTTDNNKQARTNNTSAEVTIRIGIYTSSQKILLVGEGDFSFSTCLATAFDSADNMVATSLNTQEFLVENYGSFSANKKELEKRGCTVLHGIDTTQMSTHPQLSNLKFDRIIFNFPHSGFRSTDKDTPNLELGRHQKLVSGFLRNAKWMINVDGQIHIRHKCNATFLKWNIPRLASDQGLLLIEEHKFNPNEYPGYHTKYGFWGDRDFHCHPSKTYIFGLAG